MKTQYVLGAIVVSGMWSSLARADFPLTADVAIEVPGKTGGFDWMLVDTANERLLAAHSKAGSLSLLDLKTEKLLPSIETGAAQGLAIDTKNGKYFVGDEEEKKIVVIDSVTLKKLSEIKVDGPVDAMAFDPKNGMLFADEDNGRKVWVIDTKKEKVVATVPIAGDPEYVEYGPSTDRVYQNIKSDHSILVINPNDNKIEAKWSTLPAESPHGLALDEKRNRVFSAGKNGKLVAIDLKTGRTVASADIGENVDQIAFDPASRIIYCAGRETLSAVRETDSGLESLGKVPSPKGAHTLAVDPKSHAVWISYFDAEKSRLKKFKAGSVGR